MLDPLVVDCLPQLQFCHAFGTPPTRGEVALTLMRMANAKAMGPDNPPADLLKIWVRASSCLIAVFHGVILRIWQEQKAPQPWKDAVFQVLHKTKDLTECGDYRKLSLVAHAKVLLMMFTLRLGCCRTHTADSDQADRRLTLCSWSVNCKNSVGRMMYRYTPVSKISRKRMTLSTTPLSGLFSCDLGYCR